MIENATVEDLQHELRVMISETMDDMGDDAPDESSVAVELYCSLTYMYNYDDVLLAELAKRELGFMPTGARPGVSAQYPLELDPEEF